MDTKAIIGHPMDIAIHISFDQGNSLEDINCSIFIKFINLLQSRRISDLKEELLNFEALATTPIDMP